jgi:hypothetical protein
MQDIVGRLPLSEPRGGALDAAGNVGGVEPKMRGSQLGQNRSDVVRYSHAVAKRRVLS